MDVINYSKIKKVQQDLETHKSAYANQRLEDNLKVAQLDKELNDFQQTLSQVNVNQEAKQTATGYGVVSLPKNAANGQVGVSVFGNTETDEEGNTKSTISASRLKSVGKNLFDGTFKKDTYINVNGGFSTQVGARTTNKIEVMSGKQYTISGGNRTTIRIEDAYGNKVFNEQNSTTPRVITIPQNGKYLYVYYSSDGTHSSLQIEQNTVATPYEPYTESTQYLPNVGELRSLPNGTKDEIRVADKKLIKRIGTKTNIASGTIINYADMATGGQFVAYFADGTQQVGVKGDTITALAVTLTYQLAEPVEIPIEVSGTLMSYPSGTIYVENVIADAGIYTDKFTILQQDLPIKEIEKISKVDFTTGIETELDVSQAVIATDKLSFTHPDLVNGDIVFTTYFYDKEGTLGETTVTYYDSRHTVKDKTLENKFYQWTIEVDNGTPSIKLVEV
jgi:hypothetical protein